MKSAMESIMKSTMKSAVNSTMKSASEMFGLSFKERSILGDQPKPQPVANKDCKDFKWNPT